MNKGLKKKSEEMLGKIATFGTTMVKSLRRKEFIKNVDP